MMYLDDKLYYTSFIAYNPLPVFLGLYMCKVSLPDGFAHAGEDSP